MKLLASTDFALRTLMRLAATPKQHRSTEELAREMVISRNHLLKVVQGLADAGFVVTLRGAKGGVLLALPPSEITVGAVVRWFEHEQPVAECFRVDGGACTFTGRCGLNPMLAGAQRAFFAYLDQFTLAQCIVDGTMSVSGRINFIGTPTA